MDSLRSSRVIVGSFVVCFVFTACAGASVPAVTSGLPTLRGTVDARAGHFRLLHVFGNEQDGQDPYGGLIQLNGTLYGGTQSGGANSDGTIYSLSITGKERVIHSFDGSDGYGTEGELLPYHGVLYGTGGVGPNFYGNVFAITTSGGFTVLHRFEGADGLNPAAGLIATGGTLYGTTYQGGTRGEGNVYSIDTSGAEQSIYSFGTYSNDGTYPACTLLYWNKKFYGTTNGGGTYNGGTVFSLTSAGKETILYSFGKGTDGKSPYSSNLTALAGALYGTTYSGGTHGLGVVFKVLPSGVVRTLYNFGDSKSDGAGPVSGVIAYKNALYGTTDYAGAGQGTIYRVTTSGKETVLYSFKGDDGMYPYARLLPIGTNMYGTMYIGGTQNSGTAFRFTP